MIIDQLVNIQFYRGLSIDIYAGLQFLQNANPGIATGTYVINNSVKAIVSEYETIADFSRGYEAHKHIIDIQYPILGQERVKWSPIKNMTVKTPYDVIKDRTFYTDPSTQGTHVDIGNGIFAVMFPQDGHAPQHYVNNTPQLIKKITVKVSI